MAVHSACALPPPTIYPGLQGLAIGILLLAAFALPRILQLRKVPHNRVIRREQDPPQVGALATYGFGMAGFVALLLWQAGDPKMALYTALGFFGAFAINAHAFDERLGDLRVRMTERADRDAAAEVEVTLAVHVPEVTPLPAREHELEAPVAGHDVFLEQAEDGLLLVVNDGGRGRDDLFHSHGDLAAKGRKGHREKLP